ASRCLREPWPELIIRICLCGPVPAVVGIYDRHRCYDRFRLAARRDAAAAKWFFHNALLAPGQPRPRVINVDGNPSYPEAVSELKQEGKLGRRCRCRSCPYLNILWNRIIERSTTGQRQPRVRSFHGSRRTIQGYEVKCA